MTFEQLQEKVLGWTKDKSDEANNLYYNTSLIKRNRIMINQYMKELERY